ncbi:hypothetical protein PENTCL1PPCAC_22281, partial [Pristionchus entomophagus]
LQLYNVNERVTVEFRIKIIHSERREPISNPGVFSAPNNKSNVVLKVGKKKLHVSKEYLAVHSPVFDAMFFGYYAEKGKNEVEMKEIVYEEFLDLLHFIYLGQMIIPDRTVLHFLKLADRFEMKRVVELSEKYLIQTN